MRQRRQGCASGLPITSLYRSTDAGKDRELILAALIFMQPGQVTLMARRAQGSKGQRIAAQRTCCHRKSRTADPYAITGVHVACCELKAEPAACKDRQRRNLKDITPKNLPPDQLLHAGMQMSFVTGRKADRRRRSLYGEPAGRSSRRQTLTSGRYMLTRRTPLTRPATT